MGCSHYLPPIPSPLNLSLGTVCRTFSGRERRCVCGHCPHALHPLVLLHTYIRTFPPYLFSTGPSTWSIFLFSLLDPPRLAITTLLPPYSCVFLFLPPAGEFASYNLPLIPSPPTRPKPAITNYASANILIAHSRWTVSSTRPLSVRSQK